MYLKYREILAIFMRRIPDTEDNKNEVFRSDAERFFRACIELFRFEDEAGGSPGIGTAIRLLNEIELGYACWLEDQDDARRADEDG